MIFLELDTRITDQLKQILHDIDLVLEVVVRLVEVLELEQLCLLVQFLLAQQHVVDHLIDVLLFDQELLRTLAELSHSLRALRKKILGLVVFPQPLHAVGLLQVCLIPLNLLVNFLVCIQQFVGWSLLRALFAGSS